MLCPKPLRFLPVVFHFSCSKRDFCQAFLRYQARTSAVKLVNHHHLSVMNAAISGNKELEEDRLLNLGYGQQFITSLMNASIEPIPNSDGMGVVRHIFDLETASICKNIILRNITTPFWNACINVVNTPGFRIRVAAVGTPGIGKTSSTPWLIRMLLEQGQTVVYLIRTDDESSWYYEFVPQSDGTVTTNVYPESLPACRIPSLRVSSSYYIVDPSHTMTSCDPASNFVAKVIIVPSPHSGHWGEEEFEKQRDDVWGEFRYFPTWSIEELLHARPILDPTLTEDGVIDRFRQVGGVPRHVFGWSDIDFQLDAQCRAIGSALDAEKAISIFLGEMDAFDGFGEVPTSALIGFRLSPEDNGTFEEAESYLLSALVSEKIYDSYKHELWLEMLDRGPHDGGNKIFVSITRHLIASEKPRMKFKHRACVGQTEEAYTRLFRREMGTAKRDIREVMIDPIQAATRCPNVVFYSTHQTINTLFDFLYKETTGHFHIFKATCGGSYSVDVEQMKELEDKVGGGSKLSFYFLVPRTKFDSFVTDPPDPAQTDIGVSCQIYHVSIPKP